MPEPGPAPESESSSSSPELLLSELEGCGGGGGAVAFAFFFLGDLPSTLKFCQVCLHCKQPIGIVRSGRSLHNYDIFEEFKTRPHRIDERLVELSEARDEVLYRPGGTPLVDEDPNARGNEPAPQYYYVNHLGTTEDGLLTYNYTRRFLCWSFWR